MEDRYQGRVQVALEFALTIEDFDDLMDPRHLYDCCLGPKPSAFVLKKITREEKSMLSLSSLLLFIYFIYKISSFLLTSYLRKWQPVIARTSMPV